MGICYLIFFFQSKFQQVKFFFVNFSKIIHAFPRIALESLSLLNINFQLNGVFILNTKGIKHGGLQKHLISKYISNVRGNHI